MKFHLHKLSAIAIFITLDEPSYYQALAAEFLGVFILTFVVCGLGIHLENTPKIPSLVGALGGGLTLATMVWVTSGISGGNLNPAISIALMLTGELSFIKGI